MSKDDLVAVLTPMITEDDLTGISREAEPKRGITTTANMDVPNHSVEHPGEE